MAKQIFTLTQSNNTEIIGGNIEAGKAISLRGAFFKGKGMGFDGNNMKQVNFKHIDTVNGAFTAAIVNDNQNQMNPDGFNYPLLSGKEIVVFVDNLQNGQEIYVEVDYEIMDV